MSKVKEGWNWWAFLFGPFWYLYKGMLFKALAVLVFGMILGTILPVVGAIPVWIYCGLKGNEDYKEKLLKNQELTDKE